jgi:hypothetical protein
VVTAGLYWCTANKLQVAPEARDRVMALDASRSIRGPLPTSLRRTLPILIITILLFFLHRQRCS